MFHESGSAGEAAKAKKNREEHQAHELATSYRLAGELALAGSNSPPTWLATISPAPIDRDFFSSRYNRDRLCFLKSL